MSIKGGKIDASGEFIKSFRIVTDIDADAGLGTPTDPLRVDPTGTTVQPVSFTTAQHVIVDSGAGGGTQYTDGATQATPTGTVALGKDPSNVVKALPLTAAGALKVDGSAVTQPVSGTVAATQSGTWTVQPGNTANTTAWKVDGSAVTQPVSATSLPLPTGASTNASLIETHGTVAAGTAATKSELVGAVAQVSTVPAATDGQQVANQADAAGNLRINPFGNVGSAIAKKVNGAGNVTLTLTVPTGKKWFVYAGLINLTTNATVASRIPGLNVADSLGNFLFALFAGVATTASLQRFYAFGAGLPQVTGFTASNATSPMPQILLGPGMTLNTVVTAGVAGDAVIATFSILELSD